MKNDHVGHCHSHEHHHCQDHHHAFLMREDVIEKLERLLVFSETLRSIDERVGKNYIAIQEQIVKLKEEISAIPGMKPIEITDEDFNNHKHFVWNGEPIKYAGMLSEHTRVVYANGGCSLYACFAHTEDGGALYLHCNADTDGTDGKFHVVDYHIGEPAIARYFSEAVATEQYDGLMSKEDKKTLTQQAATIRGMRGEIASIDDDVTALKGQYNALLAKVAELEKKIDNGGNVQPDPIDPEPEETAKKFYVGQVQSSRTAFSGIADSALIEAATAVEVGGTKTGSFHGTKSCFFILMPSNLSIEEVSFTSGGIKSVITADWNLEHEDVTIDGVQYRVYGYRMATVSEAAPQDYDYTIKEA